MYLSYIKTWEEYFIAEISALLTISALSFRYLWWCSLQYKVKSINLLLKIFKLVITCLSLRGVVFIEVSLLIFAINFYPVLLSELEYSLSKPSSNTQIKVVSSSSSVSANNSALETNIVSASSTAQANNVKVVEALDDNFGIVIPSINLNTKVVGSVDPFKPSKYESLLNKGIVHANNTKVPGQGGHIFLFSHSTVNISDLSKYNAFFTLLPKIKEGDEVYIFYNHNEFKYKVKEKIYVDPSETSYLTKKSNKETLTLMTCWPVGTPIKRLIVIAEPYIE